MGHEPVTGNHSLDIYLSTSHFQIIGFQNVTKHEVLLSEFEVAQALTN